MYFNCHTAFSFKYGTLQVKDLFEEARRCDIHHLVITEINNTASYIEMLRHCAERRPWENNLTKYGHEGYFLTIAVGVEFRSANDLLYIIIAKNNLGFERVNRFLSYHNLQNKPFPLRAPEMDDVSVVYPFRKIEPEYLRQNEFIGVRQKDLSQFRFYEPFREYSDKFVAWHPVTFGSKIDFNTHRLLRAIDNNTLLSKLDESQQADPGEIMMRTDDFKSAFSVCPELIDNANQLTTGCSLEFQMGTDKNIAHLFGSPEADWHILVESTQLGVKSRYSTVTETLQARIDKELTIIAAKGFCSYYLVAYDLITFANEKGYPYVGRGSGANSVVAYCLGITNVDPIELDLYFERFLNAERTTPPDFDLDFSWDNRDAVYEYIFAKYPKDHVCLLATHVTYQRRSVVRELGKVFGLPKEEIDLIVEDPGTNMERDHITKLIFQYTERIKDLPSNISIHAGGVLITEKPIFAYTALELPPKGYPVSHFEMHNAEDMGIFKFDILSQRGLGHLKDAVIHVKRNRGIDVDINRFKAFKVDEKIKDLMRNSKAMGCFYVESPAMRMLLGKLRCDNYLTLVAASSIIRPGVARSGMMRSYIERFHAVQRGDTYDVIHPKMDELMKETYGVMVYQEDVIKVAHHFAHLTLTEADVLRRGMSGKYRSRQEFQRVRERFFKNCENLQYDSKVTDRVWYEIESFSGYSFAKGHSASYAVESYQSLYLKAHYPLEFMVGVINNFGGFYKTEFYFHEARMNGGNINAPCVNKSEHLTTIKGNDIYIGFIHLKSLEHKIAREVSIERFRNGEFTSMDNFLRRITIGLEQIRILIRMGSFRFTGKSKQSLLWEAMLYFSNVKTRVTATIELFDESPNEYPLPILQRHELEDAFDEIELLGFPLCDPFLLLNTNVRGNVVAKKLGGMIGKYVHIVGYLVTTKDTSTLKGEAMHFGTFYDLDGDFFDTVHFPNIARHFPFRGRGFYSIKGKVVEDFGIFIIEVNWMDKLPLVNKRADEFLRESMYDEKKSDSKIYPTPL
ncbi:MAG: DNA polymerase III subunit alpha [Chryseolinea sp.]